MKINQGGIPAAYLKTKEMANLKSEGRSEGAGKNREGVVLNPEDQLSISYLMEESEKNYQQLRDIVKDMLIRQGVEVDNLKALKDKDLEGVVIDETAQREAQKMVGPEGPLNAENTSERIFQFAKAISGGDKAKFEKLKTAIEDGFREAEKMLGGQLPVISKETYDLVMKKLDDWAEEE